MRIAVLGHRGLPASYSGVERHVEEIGARLAEAGHDVVVFCRTNGASERPRTHRGMRLRHLPAISTKHLETITHTALSTVRSLRGFDVVHFHAVGPGLLAPLPRYLSGARVIQTVHGFDADRAKWGGTARGVLSIAQRMSARVPDATITVSRFLQDEYRRRYGRETVFIPNGVTPPQPRPADEVVRRYDLRPRGYALFVGRLVPEKAVHLLVRAFRQVRSDLRLVIVGGSANTDGYARQLLALAKEDGRVLLTGPLYGPLVEELYENAALFVSPSLLEGSPLTLLEAAGRGVPIVASDIPAQRELVSTEMPGYRLAPAGDEEGLAAAVGRALADPEGERAGARRLQHLVLEGYTWDAAARATADVYTTTLRPSRV